MREIGGSNLTKCPLFQPDTGFSRRKAWAADPLRRAKAGVPDDVTFLTKPQLAPDQIRPMKCRVTLMVGRELIREIEAKDFETAEAIAAHVYQTLGTRYFESTPEEIVDIYSEDLDGPATAEGAA